MPAMWCSSETKECMHVFCASRREELDVTCEDWFSSCRADAKIAISAIDDIVENKICNAGLKQKYSNPDDKFFCQLTICQNCRKCDYKTMKSFRQYVVYIKQCLRDEHTFARLILRKGGRTGFSDELKKISKKVNDYKKQVILNLLTGKD